MFGIDLNVIAIALFGAFAFGGLAYFFLFNQIENEVNTERRVRSIKGADHKRRSIAEDRVRNEAEKRRKSVQETLDMVESKQKARNKHAKNPPLKIMMRQAGLTWSIQNFFLGSIAFGIVCTAAAFFAGVPLYAVAGVFLVTALGMPRWLVGHIRKKRFKKFTEEFPNAVDVIVRGVKAGLPLNDCVRIIATEAAEPVCSEFRKIMEAQQMGIPMHEAVSKLYENIPLSEANFFGIVIAIQQKAGGNLSEALGNLSKVLRDRKMMKAKIVAMSTEAKASGAIIGCLPVVVAVLVYFTSPDYISLLFTETSGNIVLLISALWMACGVFVMKKMINFDF